MRILFSLAAAGMGLLAAPGAAQPSGTSDYSKDEAWLCRPGRIDGCATDQSVTVVEADGATKVQALVPDTDRKFDCFYVYPTVSNDAGGNSDMTANAEELRVAHAQA